MGERGELRAQILALLKEKAPKLAELAKEHGPTALAFWPEGEVAAILLAAALKQAKDRGWLEDPRYAALKRLAVELEDIYDVDPVAVFDKVANHSITRRVSVAVKDSKAAQLGLKLARVVGSARRHLGE